MKQNRSEGKIRIGITHGDINGIGYELIIKSLSDIRFLELCTPIVYGSSKVAAYHRKTLNIENFSLNMINHPDEANPKRANIIACVDDANTKVELGKSTEIAGIAAFQALERATQDILDGNIDALLTAPINKHNIQSETFKFAGHTEYLAEKSGAKNVLMLMVSNLMKVGVVTTHIPIAEVATTITTEKILSKLKILNKSLIEDFNISKPIIAMLGLNPHAGDKGIVGKEENEILIPAIQKANQDNILVMGPYSADGFFGSGSFKKFDAILAMYHDQGLIPFKALTYEGGVNYTCGLPFIRTSPAHGTAYDIAGQNIASINSFHEAIYQAIDAFKNRESYKELIQNQMKSSVTLKPED